MASMNARDQLFAKIALKNRLVSKSQLREGLALVERSNGKADLASTMVAKGHLTEAVVRKLLDGVERAAEQRSGSEGAPSAGRRGALPKGDVKLANRVILAPKGATNADEFAERDCSHLHGQPLGEYLKLAREIGASDFHYQAGAAPFMRLHGTHVPLKHPKLTAEDTERAIRDMLTAEEWKELEENFELDFCYEREAEQHGRYRTNAFRQRRGYDIIFRLISSEVPTLEGLNMPASLEHFTTYRQGIVLITGPAGSGKTMTMAAMVELINQRNYDHIITVEDPIEVMFESKNCNVNQRHVYRHTESFGVALRSGLRADPDVIVVGEMRDLETISMAITAAETGHLVLATLHTTNAIRSIDRIIDVFPPKEQDQIRAMVSESIRGVISQQLLPRADGLGRVPALEIMFSTPAVANLIRERKTYQLPSVLQTGKSRGMCTMDDSIMELLNRGLVTRETAAHHAEDPRRFAA